MKNSIKSCFGVSCLMLFYFVANTQPQSKLSVTARIDFYSIPISDPDTDIPEPKYDVSGELELNQAAYVELNWWFAKNLGCSFGLGIHNFNQSVDVLIDRDNSNFPIAANHRVWKIIGLSPTIGLLWKWNKMQTHLYVSNFEPLDIQKSTVIPHYYVHSYNPETEIFNSVEVFERLTPSNAFYSYNLWQLNFQYQLTNNVGMLLGIETKLGKQAGIPYRIQIYTYEDNQVEDKILANDYKFQAQYTAITVGMSYTFKLKKGDKVKSKDKSSK